jgi:hypothetical protein
VRRARFLDSLYRNKPCPVCGPDYTVTAIYFPAGSVKCSVLGGDPAAWRSHVLPPE